VAGRTRDDPVLIAEALDRLHRAGWSRGVAAFGSTDRAARSGEEPRSIACNTNGRPLANGLARALTSIQGLQLHR
jgi:hypothetical protein